VRAKQCARNIPRPFHAEALWSIEYKLMSSPNMANTPPLCHHMTRRINNAKIYFIILFLSSYPNSD